MFASEVMDRSAALLNDQAKATFNYSNMLPYLGQANDELVVQLALHGISVEKQYSAVATITKGTSTFPIPVDMLLPLSMMERLAGNGGIFNEMKERVMPPEDTKGDALVYWSYYDLQLKVGPANDVGANTDREVKLVYTRVLTDLTSQASVVEVPISKLFLSTRTAALAAHYIGENQERSQSLDVEARGQNPDINIGGHLGDLVRLYVRNNQGGALRRRPYRRPRAYGR